MIKGYKRCIYVSMAQHTRIAITLVLSNVTTALLVYNFLADQHQHGVHKVRLQNG